MSLRKGSFLLSSVPLCMRVCVCLCVSSRWLTAQNGSLCWWRQYASFFFLPSFLALLLPDGPDTWRFPLAVRRWWRRRRRSRCVPPTRPPSLCAVTLCRAGHAHVHLPCARARASVRHYVLGGARDIWRFASKANKSAMPEIRPWPLPSNCADKLRGSLIKRPVTDVMSSTHKPPADCESHIQQSQLSARKHGGRQGGRPLLRSLPPPPISLAFISTSPFTLSHLQRETLVWHLQNICLTSRKMIWRVEANLSSQTAVAP